MKKITLVSLIACSVAACSLLNSADVGPKMVVTCQNVSNSITVTAQEAAQFVKDAQDKKITKDSPICLKNEATTKFCIELLSAPSKKCSAETVL